jgi:hypothetical protein
MRQGAMRSSSSVFTRATVRAILSRPLFLARALPLYPRHAHTSTHPFSLHAIVITTTELRRDLTDGLCRPKSRQFVDQHEVKYCMERVLKPADADAAAAALAKDEALLLGQTR